jgi:hypothetical protein
MSRDSGVQWNWLAEEHGSKGLVGYSSFWVLTQRVRVKLHSIKPFFGTCILVLFMSHFPARLEVVEMALVLLIVVIMLLVSPKYSTRECNHVIFPAPCRSRPTPTSLPRISGHMRSCPFCKNGVAHLTDQ